MGLIDGFWSMLFGGGRNVIAETAGAFVENAENGAARGARARSDALAQFEAEFAVERQGGFDRFMDGLNRLPRPLMALGTVGLVASAMVAPNWFSARMSGLALVPEPLWWLMGAIVSFYFGARYQAKALQFRRPKPAIADKAPPAAAPDRADIWTENRALEDWRHGNE